MTRHKKKKKNLIEIFLIETNDFHDTHSLIGLISSFVSPSGMMLQHYAVDWTLKYDD